MYFSNNPSIYNRIFSSAIIFFEETYINNEVNPNFKICNNVR